MVLFKSYHVRGEFADVVWQTIQRVSQSSSVDEVKIS